MLKGSKYIINLFKHNADSFERVKSAFLNGENTVGILQATGTGKTYQALELILENPEKKVLYLVPNNAIIDHIKSTIESCGLDFEKDFSNVTFMTYQGLASKDDKEIANIETDLIIFDEFHHIGAPYWGDKIQTLLDTHPDAWKFGMSAYSIRRRGTSYERDMALPGGNELFSDKIVTYYDLADAMIDGVLPIPIFTTIYSDIEKRLESIEKTTGRLPKGELKTVLESELIKIRRLLPKVSGIQNLLKMAIAPNGKYIYFCPPGIRQTGDEELEFGEDNPSFTKEEKYLDTHIRIITQILDSIGIIDRNLYKTSSYMFDAGKSEREAFYHDISEKLRIMFSVNQYNEGVHVPNVTGIIMSRSTNSDIIAFEQIGRCLSVCNNNLDYSNLTLKELIELAYERQIDINNILSEDISIEETRQIIIDILSSPYIIDLAGNIKFIQELENEIKEKVEHRIKNHIPVSRRALALAKGEFTILDVKNSVLNKVVDGLKERLTIDKIAEFIEIMNTGDMAILYNENDYYFSNGDKCSYYYRDHRNAILDRLYNSPNYQVGYETAKKLVYLKEQYNLKDRIADYIEMLNTGKLPRELKYSYQKFPDGSSCYTFWEKYRDEISEELNTNPKYQTGYDVAKQVVWKTIYESTNTVVDTKIEEFVIELANGNATVLSNHPNKTFKNGSPMKSFYNFYKERILKYIEKHPEYAYAIEVINNFEYNNNKENRYREFIEILESGDTSVLSVTNTLLFKNGSPISRFYSDRKNKETIWQMLTSLEEYASYDTARRLIKEYEFRNDMENKYKEFIEKLNDNHAEILNVYNGLFFNDGTKCDNFFAVHQEDIARVISLPEYNHGYEFAKRKIEEYMYNEYLGGRIHDFIDMLNTGNTDIFSTSKNVQFKNGDLTCKFWIRHRYKIIAILFTDPRYQEGYENAKKIIEELELKCNDTSKKKLAKTYGIPYFEIKDIPISELLAKCEYLKSLKIKPYEHDQLHEIFKMSNKRLIKKYNISLEELLDTYVLKWSR